jgi:hypothetical protein
MMIALQKLLFLLANGNESFVEKECFAWTEPKFNSFLNISQHMDTICDMDNAIHNNTSFPLAAQYQKYNGFE